MVLSQITIVLYERLELGAPVEMLYVGAIQGYTGLH